MDRSFLDGCSGSSGLESCAWSWVRRRAERAAAERDGVKAEHDFDVNVLR